MHFIASYNSVAKAKGEFAFAFAFAISPISHLH
jgi:hypothetical protein